MSHAKVDAAFLSILNHTGNLLSELKRGRLEGNLKMLVDGCAGAHAHALSVAKFATSAALDPGNNGGVFDGGPQEDRRQSQAELDRARGVKIADAGGVPPPDSSDDLILGFESVTGQRYTPPLPQREPTPPTLPPKSLTLEPERVSGSFTPPPDPSDLPREGASAIGENA